jgi:hypothetical protein
MNLTFPQLLAATIGALLISAAIRKKNPIDLLKEALTQNAQQTTANKAAQQPATPQSTTIPAAPIYKNK